MSHKALNYDATLLLKQRDRDQFYYQGSGKEHVTDRQIGANAAERRYRFTTNDRTILNFNVLHLTPSWPR